MGNNHYKHKTESHSLKFIVVEKILRIEGDLCEESENGDLPEIALG